MRSILSPLLALVVALGATAPGAAQAAEVCFEVPSAPTTRLLELCEILRVRMRVRTADWSIGDCAGEVNRLGFVELEKRETKRAADRTSRATQSTALSTLRADYPVQVTRAECGDGTVDSIGPYLEECDDGNTDDGDGCSAGCTVEP